MDTLFTTFWQLIEDVQLRMQDLADLQGAYLLAGLAVAIAFLMWVLRRRKQRRSYGSGLRKNMQKMREDAPFKK